MADKKESTKLRTYVTGFCTNGSHEGTTLFSAKGTMMRACSGEFTIQGKLYSCSCNCHEAFREMEELIGFKFRRQVAQAALIPPVFMGSTVEEKKATPIDVPTGEETLDTAPVDVQDTPPVAPMSGVSLLPPALPPTPAPVVRPILPAKIHVVVTPTGRKAKGQLENQVTAVINDWFHNGTAEAGQVESLTPKQVAEILGDNSSLGAIHAIAKRLEKSGRATLAAKPFRIVGFK